jgi:hypothetical protein
MYNKASAHDKIKNYSVLWRFWNEMLQNNPCFHITHLPHHISLSNLSICSVDIQQTGQVTGIPTLNVSSVLSCKGVYIMMHYRIMKSRRSSDVEIFKCLRSHCIASASKPGLERKQYTVNSQWSRIMKCKRCTNYNKKKTYTILVHSQKVTNYFTFYTPSAYFEKLCAMVTCFCELLLTAV